MVYRWMLDVKNKRTNKKIKKSLEEENGNTNNYG